MRHLDLFSGIGGFALAAQQVWGDDYECAGFCDNNRFCQEVLKKRFPNCRIHGDIRALTNAPSERCDSRLGGGEGGQVLPDEGRASEEGKQERDRRNCGAGEDAGIDLITGGFPCQPFSNAGKRRGKADDRFLWPEMLRVIGEFRPRWVIAENVRGILSIEGGLVFEQVCAGLEGEGYAVRAFIIPACAVNAPHRRDRVWIIANRVSNGKGSAHGSEVGERITGRQEQNECEGSEVWSNPTDGDSNASDTEGEPRPAGQSGVFDGAREGQLGGGAGGCADTDSLGPRLERAGKGEHGGSGRPAAQGGRQREVWNKDWPEVAAEFCRIHDGISHWMELYFGGIEDDTPITKLSGQEVRVLRKIFQSEKIREKIGGLFEIQDTAFLLEAMCWIQKRIEGHTLGNDVESKSVQKAFLPRMWKEYIARHTSHRWRYNEQQSKQLKDAVPQLSYEVALELKKAWDCIRFTRATYESTEYNHDGFKLSKAGHRVERLKALGNAIVPQVAAEIMRTIKLIDEAKP